MHTTLVIKIDDEHVLRRHLGTLAVSGIPFGFTRLLNDHYEFRFATEELARDADEILGSDEPDDVYRRVHQMERELRICHFDCGRVLREHEQHCPDCVPDIGPAPYNAAGGF